MTATITALPASKPAKVRRVATKTGKPVIRRTTVLNRRFAVASAVAAASLTAMSLDHLATGVAKIMSAPGWQAWVIAGAIDLGFITAELALTACDAKTVEAIKGYAHPIVYGALAASATLNCMSMTEGKVGLAMAPGILAGCALPLAIFAFSRLSSKLWTGK